MRKVVVSMSVLFVGQLSALGLMCQEDLRMENGSSRELIISQNEQGNFKIQSSFIESLHSPNIEIEVLAKNTTCKIDEKYPLAFCDDSEGQKIVVSERREVSIPSLNEEDKKETNKYTDIKIFNEAGEVVKHIEFDYARCKLF